MDATPPQPKNDDADIAVYAKSALVVLYYATYPLYKIGQILFLLLLLVLKPIWNVVSFITLPLTYLVAFLGYMLSLPFTLIARLETIYIFLGTAVLIGLIAGVVLALLSSVTTSTFHLDASEQPMQKKRLRTLSSFRASRKKRKSSDVPPPLPLRPSAATSPKSPLSPISSGGGGGGLRARGLLSSTILEEDDSDESETGS